MWKNSGQIERKPKNTVTLLSWKKEVFGTEDTFEYKMKPWQSCKKNVKMFYKLYFHKRTGYSARTAQLTAHKKSMSMYWLQQLYLDCLKWNVLLASFKNQYNFTAHCIFILLISRLYVTWPSDINPNLPDF